MSVTFQDNHWKPAAGVVPWILVLTFFCNLASAQDVRPDNLDIQFNRAEAAWRSGTSVLEAKARIDRVIMAVPDDIQALKLRAEILIALDRPVDAMRDARHVTRIAPDDGEAYMIMSEAASLAGDVDMASAAIDNAIEHLPRLADLHLRLARTAMLIGAYDRAEYCTRTVLDISPGDPNAHYQLAGILIRAEREDEAAHILAQGLRESILDIEVIRRDNTLAPLLTHPILSDTLD